MDGQESEVSVENAGFIKDNFYTLKFGEIEIVLNDEQFEETRGEMQAIE